MTLFLKYIPDPAYKCGTPDKAEDSIVKMLGLKSRR